MTRSLSGFVSTALMTAALGLGGCTGCGKSPDTGGEGSSSSSSGVAGSSSGVVGSSGGVSSSLASSGLSGGSSTLGGSSGALGSSGSSGTTTGPAILFTAPANDGTTVSAPIALNATVTFTATITDSAPIQQSGVSWVLTPPSGTAGAPSGGTLNGDQASFIAALGTEGTWTVSLTYSNGVNAPVTAQLTAAVYANLPPQLAWIAPTNDGTAVTGARRIGTQQLFQATLSDDATLLQQNVSWSHLHPDATTTSAQGTIVGTGPNQARLEYTADLATLGTHTITVSYNDGTRTSSLALTVNVLADLPATVTFTQPDNAAGAVTAPTAVGDTVTFVVRISDDAAIIPQNGTFSITSPSGTTPNQGTVMITGGTSATVQLAVLFNAAGNWQVQYTYTDGGGNTVTSSLTVMVATDPAPVVTITAPGNNGTAVTVEVRQNSQLTFRGSIRDNQAIAAQNVLWTFTPATGQPITSQGTIQGAGNTVTSVFNVASAGPPGTAQVSLRYTDVGGATSTATLAVPVVSNNTPSVVITRPTNNGVTAENPVRVNTQVDFRATITDDLDIVPSNILWTLTSPGGSATNNPGGYTPGNPATTGTATFTASLVAAGDWTASVRYTDGTGLSRSAQILITAQANTAPTCQWTAPSACMAAGQHTLQVTLGDADGDFPVVASILSSNAADTVTTSTVTYTGQNNATRNVTLTLAPGTRTVSCTPTDSTGLAGTPATMTITTVAAPTISFALPADGALIADGSPVNYSLLETHDAAATVTTTLTDSAAGPQALNASLAGTITAPFLGIHELVATDADSCNGLATASVRYAVTTAGGAPTTLGSAVDSGGATLDVRSAQFDGSRLLAGTSSNNAEALYAVNTGALTAQAFEPDSGGGDQVLNNTQSALNGISLGTANAGTRWEAYATGGDGLFVCHGDTNNGTRCRQFRQGDPVGNGAQFRSDAVVDVAIAGTGAVQGEGFAIVLFQDRVQVFTLTWSNGQVGMSRVVDIPRGDTTDSILGNPQVVRVTTFSTNPAQVQFWVGTTDGAHLVDATLSGGNIGRTIQHFDSNRPQNNNAWPSFDVRDIALDPANPDVAWFALATGIGHHAGPGFGAGTFDAVDTTTGGTPQNLTSIAVDRFPDSNRPILWVGSAGTGFWRVDPSLTPALGLNITVADGVGLPSNTVRTVSISDADSAHVKWLGTAQGLWGYRGK